MDHDHPSREVFVIADISSIEKEIESMDDTRKESYEKIRDRQTTVDHCISIDPD